MQMTKVLLVTGGSAGIGAATVRLAAARGYKVAFSYRSSDAAACKPRRLPGTCRRSDGRLR